METYYELVNQGQAVGEIIKSSLYRCSKAGQIANATKLPRVSAADIDRCKKHVSGHIHLMRKSSPAYYREIEAVLSVNNACLLYLYSNFDVFGRYGNQKLKDELAAINLKLGANLSEENVGTNAAVIASRSPKGTWVIGDDHYMSALKPYACYAFPIQGKYGRSGFIMLVTPKDNLDQRVCELFRLIEATECIVTAGLVTEDVIIKDTMMRNEYSKQQTDNIVLIVDSSGFITYANDVYYETFKQEPLNTINRELVDLRPEFADALDCLTTGHKVTGRRVKLLRPDIETSDFLMDCMPINSKNECLGMMITVYKSKPEKGIGDQGNVAKYSFDDLLGVSDNFIQLKRFAERIASTPSPVLIQGESGTGKELFAHAIHHASTRHNKPFVAINCAAIPKELIGSELFGYVGGSFTGASRSGAKGKFELANGGTLFLDEIGEMPLEMQSVLLRALEDNAVTRIGGDKPIPVNVRLITATNRDLQQYISEGKFRADLYYRINVINLNMIPLRHRREDIPVLAEAYIRACSKKSGTHITGISSDALQAMMEYGWPGNIRELRNAIERGVIICDGGDIGLHGLPSEISHQKAEFQEPDLEDPGTVRAKITPVSVQYTKRRKKMAEQLMEEYHGNKSRVAKELGVSRSTLYRILEDQE